MKRNKEKVTNETPSENCCIGQVKVDNLRGYSQIVFCIA